MSGESLNYIAFKIEDELSGRMEDAELEDLVKDIASLAHALEWYLSSDCSRDHYISEVKEFKEKWFKGSQKDRLKGYIDEKLDRVRDELYTLIGEEVKK